MFDLFGIRWLPIASPIPEVEGWGLHWYGDEEDREHYLIRAVTEKKYSNGRVGFQFRIRHTLLRAAPNPRKLLKDYMDMKRDWFLETGEI